MRVGTRQDVHAVHGSQQVLFFMEKMEEEVRMNIEKKRAALALPAALNPGIAVEEEEEEEHEGKAAKDHHMIDDLKSGKGGISRDALQPAG